MDKILEYSVVVLISLFLYSVIKGAASFGMSIGENQTIENSKDQFYCNFKMFKRDFIKEKWGLGNNWKYSLFGIDEKYNQNYIHAGILKINNIGYLPINIFEYRKIRNFIENQWDEMMLEQKIIKKYKLTETK